MIIWSVQFYVKIWSIFLKSQTNKKYNTEKILNVIIKNKNKKFWHTSKDLLKF